MLSALPERLARGRSWLSLCLKRQHAADHARYPLPVFGFDSKLLYPTLGNAVVARSTVVLGYAPLARNPTFLLQAQKRRVDRALVQLQHVFAQLFNAPANSEAMQRAQRLQCLQDHQIQRSL